MAAPFAGMGPDAGLDLNDLLAIQRWVNCAIARIAMRKSHTDSRLPNMPAEAPRGHFRRVRKCSRGPVDRGYDGGPRRHRSPVPEVERGHVVAEDDPVDVVRRLV